jgi:hypothetical protein
MITTLPDEPSREDVLRFISSSASYGNLGLFVGAGFSQAVLNTAYEDIALSWGQLLRRAADKMEVDCEKIGGEGDGYPTIASNICSNYANKTGKTYDQAANVLKEHIASLTCWYPDRKRQAKYGSYLTGLSPTWVITTNYDLVIESLLTGRSIPLGPNDQLTIPRGIVPVYHLHGIRTNPKDIVVTQEDYVSLFRPNEYRQIRLALTVRESTTLFLGYNLGDINVLTAIDWSNKVFKGEKRGFPHEAIQLLRRDTPKQKPYKDHRGLWIVEISDLEHFFQEYEPVRLEELEKTRQRGKKLCELLKLMKGAGDDLVKSFIDNESFRKSMIRALSSAPTDLISGFVALLDKAIQETWTRTVPDGKFEGYNQNLNIILDILTAFKANNIPPALLQLAADGLERVGRYVGPSKGQSFAAGKTWKNRKKELSEDIVRELRSLAAQYGYPYINRLLNNAKATE